MPVGNALPERVFACGGAANVSEADRAALRELLVANYTSLSQRLARRLGSAESASEALQDAYLRLHKGPELGPIRSPKEYLFRIALNIATDRRRAEARKLTSGEVDALLNVADDAPDPERTAEAKSELRALEQALAELPERRRAIFVAALVENVPRRDLARRYNISVRTVDFEVQRALEHGLRRLQESRDAGFGSAPPESSTE
ncbi:RNA polymerase sigma factor [Hyphomicrobium sp. CS1BSMeth3]|uniref:RNA polymerase sigma factor n=1 Tax=Hyphomicrobium sp. CS1BSMeth3 TaxID=1892844 RepID=UPI001576B2FE|nr:RNA polymerase sigma factor [Hyphomicrobium sp. CS1BSMeth3]